MLAVPGGRSSGTLGGVIEVPFARFETLVGDALDSIPPEIGGFIDNLAVVVEDIGEDPDLLGLYEGIPLTERDDYGGLALPDRITVYQLPICALCDSEAEVVEQILVTVVHEVAHHFGIDDDQLIGFGWG